MRCGYRLLAFVFCVVGLMASTGCVVPQPRGQGLYQYVQEPTVGGWYHLYLPVDYVRNQGRHPNPKVKRWPLVMTFHGMKPYDNSLPQEREWEQQADIYGYIICAPDLLTSDSFMEYPLTREHGYVLRDKQAVIAIMDHVCATTLADRNRVLSTSWSCGGYMAHYFPNRFPERFACIATRLSNFSDRLMIEETVPRYRDRVGVALFIGDGDFPACRIESEEAVAWYMARNFKVVRGRMIDNMGHQRIPQTAAAFFAEQLGIEPLRPLEAAQTLARVQMTEYHPPPELLAKMSPRVAPGAQEPALAQRGKDAPPPPIAAATVGPIVGGSPVHDVSRYAPLGAGKNYPPGRTPSYDPMPRRESSVKTDVLAMSTPPSGSEAVRTGSDGSRDSNWLAPPQPVKRPSDDTTRRSPAQTEPGRSPASAPRSGSQVSSAQTPLEQAAPDRPATQHGGGSPTSKDPSSDRVASRTGTGNLQTGPSPSSRQPSGNPRPGASEASTQRPPSPHAPPPAGTDRERLITVKLNGPAIGRAPHYIGYAVDLPRSQAEGADFLWMDNGVWIGDEPRGVKILETPGLHKISVLVVTRDNAVYRGYATVQVLEPFPSVGSVAGG